MKLVNLHISKNESYQDNPGQYKGTVQLEGPNGKQELTLTNASLSSIFTIIQKDCVATSKHNADQTKRAIEEAAAQPLLDDQASNILEQM
jgi:hypothetical protein